MDVAPVVLEMAPAIVEEIPNRAKDMKPLELSNCFWALAKPKDCAPDVLNAVPAIVAQIAKKAEDMVAQGLSNCPLGIRAAEGCCAGGAAGGAGHTDQDPQHSKAHETTRVVQLLVCMCTVYEPSAHNVGNRTRHCCGDPCQDQ